MLSGLGLTLPASLAMRVSGRHQVIRTMECAPPASSPRFFLALTPFGNRSGSDALCVLLCKTTVDAARCAAAAGTAATCPPPRGWCHTPRAAWSKQAWSECLLSAIRALHLFKILSTLYDGGRAARVVLPGWHGRPEACESPKPPSPIPNLTVYSWRATETEKPHTSNWV